MKNVPLWQTLANGAAPWEGYGPLEDSTEADVCVVGLGGSGLSAILELLDRGLRVVGLDAGPVAGGAAGRNGGLALAGLVSFYHDARRELGRERALGLYRATMEEQERMLRLTPEDARRTGSLRIAVDEAEGEDCVRQFEAMEQDELPVELYDGAEGRGLLFPTDLAFNPLARCRSLARLCTERGARLFEDSEATEITGTSVTSRGHGVSCGAVVVAIDGRLDLVLAELAGAVRTARLQMLGTEPANDVSLPRPMYLRQGYEYAQQLPDGRIALGGFRDMHEDAEWTHSPEPTAEIQDMLTSFLRECIGTRAKITHRWGASVGYVKAALPIVEEVRPGVWAAGGYSGTGNLMGALAGRSAAAAAAGEPGLHGF